MSYHPMADNSLTNEFVTYHKDHAHRRIAGAEIRCISQSGHLGLYCLALALIIVIE